MKQFYKLKLVLLLLSLFVYTGGLKSHYTSGEIDLSLSIESQVLSGNLIYSLLAEQGDVKLYYALHDCNGSTYAFYKIENGGARNITVSWLEDVEVSGQPVGLNSIKSYNLGANTSIYVQSCTNLNAGPHTDISQHITGLYPGEYGILVSNLTIN